MLSGRNGHKQNQQKKKWVSPQVTYEEEEMGGLPVLVVTPISLASEEKIEVYTHGGAYGAQTAKSTLNSAALFAHGTGLKVISIDYTLAPHAR